MMISDVGCICVMEQHVVCGREVVYFWHLEFGTKELIPIPTAENNKQRVLKGPRRKKTPPIMTCYVVGGVGSHHHGWTGEKRIGAIITIFYFETDFTY